MRPNSFTLSVPYLYYISLLLYYLYFIPCGRICGFVFFRGFSHEALELSSLMMTLHVKALEFCFVLHGFESQPFFNYTCLHLVFINLYSGFNCASVTLSSWQPLQSAGVSKTTAGIACKAFPRCIHGVLAVTDLKSVNNERHTDLQQWLNVRLFLMASALQSSGIITAFTSTARC